MTLCDTGPMVAIVDESDFHHRKCVEALARIRDSHLVTTWPCLTEAMHFLGRAGGWAAQERLWTILIRGMIVIDSTEIAEWQRVFELMKQYFDSPMDLADASFVAAAERHAAIRVFTLDGHFYGYRALRRRAFEIIP